MKRLILLFLLTLSQISHTQFHPINGVQTPELRRLDSLNSNEISVKINGKTHYTDYKIITQNYDTIVIDTTLTIKKEYKFNFLRKDNFGLHQFHNQGETFNSLSYDFANFSMYPDIGFRAKQFAYLTHDEIFYYQVPTPTSEVMYKTGLEQGQVLDALFTVNFSKRFNVSVAYKGLRSLGHYRRSLASIGNFRTSFSYETPKNQYAIRGYFTKQDIMNQQSGGLTEQSLTYFVDDDENFSERARLDVNLDGTENTLNGSRVFLDHSFKLFSSKDSLRVKNFSNLKIGHQFLYEEKEYSFNQTKVVKDFFGTTSLTNSENPVSELTTNNLMNNQAYLEFNSKYVLGRFKVKVNHTTSSYGYNNVFNTKVPINKIKLKAKAVSLGADWKGKIGNLHLITDISLIPGSSHLSGNYFKGEALYKQDSLFTIKANLSQVSKKPNYNFQLFQSVYDDYNWSNNFATTDTQNIGGSFLSEWINASVDFTNIIDYVYFDENNKPQQYEKSLTYFKIKAKKEFRYRKFSLENTVLYQEVTSGNNVFRVPRLVTRNSLYYTDNWFKGDPLLVNIGITFNYFSKYKMNAYNPLLAEFTLQNDTEIGYPTLDLFFNGRVRRARIFFKADNISSFFMDTNYFSAPNYPYRDFTIRFGVVWDWFI